MAVTVDQFGKALVASGLLTAEEVKALWNGIPAAERPKDGGGFAQALVESGKLTKFQAQELVDGRGGRLLMGDYAILAEIGAGGMGQVYKAQHRRMKRVVALKVMSSAAMKDAAAVKRFQREVEAAARLEHPNIVTAYDSGDAGSVKYLVMQFVDGGDLSDLVKKSGPLPIETAVDYVIQAARGLAFAHGAGVVHRDIKPANLLLDKKGVVKILDMGLARIEDGDGLTATEQVMGTVDYMSPEQAADTKSAEGRSDIYSLGCTLWYLLTAKKLYDGDTMISRLMKHRAAPLPSLVKERDDATWPLEQVLHKMIAKRAADRYQTMDEVIAALEPHGGGSSGGMGSSIGGGKGQSAELASFMKAITGGAGKPAVQTPATSPQVDATAAFSSAEVGTDPKSALHTRGSTTPTAARPQAAVVRKPKPPVKLIAAGILGAALLVVAGVIVKVRDKDGNVVAELNVPNGTSVEVTPTPKTPTPPTSVASVPPRSHSLSVAELLTSPDYVWTEPEALGPEVNIGDYNKAPSLSRDGLTLWFSAVGGTKAEVQGQGDDDLWVSRRTSLGAPWEAATNVGPPLNHKGKDINAAISADGLTVVCWRYPVFSLFESKRATTTAPWSEPVRLSAQLTDDNSNPCLSPDALELLFTSISTHKICLSTRPDRNAPWGTPTELPQLSGGLEAAAIWVSPDGRSMLGNWLISRAPNRRFDYWLAERSTPTDRWSVPKKIELPQDMQGIASPYPLATPTGLELYFQLNQKICVTRRVPKPRAATAAPAEPRTSVSGPAANPSLTGSASPPLAVATTAPDSSALGSVVVSRPTPGANSAGVVYLDDLAETSFHGQFLSKPGSELFAGNWKDAIKQTDAPPAHGLIVHPAKDDEARLVYDLGSSFASLEVSARCAADRGNPIFVEIFGDGRSLARSVDLTTVKRTGAALTADVRGVKELRLVCDAQKITAASHVMLIEPRLTPVADSKSPVSDLKAPPPAVFPFDAATARKHQQAWAKHLGTQVETPNSVGMKMVLIPPGEFLMGSTDEQVEVALKVADEIKADQATKDHIQNSERPQHKVVITKPFLMSATEVTIGQFRQFVEATEYVTETERLGGGSTGKKDDAKKAVYDPQHSWRRPGYAITADSPASQITWKDAVAFCDWLSEQEKKKYRLPTEGEWEYACRAGTTTQYSFGDNYGDLGQYGWYNKNAGGKAHPVGTKLPNAFSLLDMHGNLQEWCGDFYDEKWYEKSSPNDPHGAAASSHRVLRGGNWYYFASHCRSAYRNSYPPSTRNNQYGFRCVSEFDGAVVKQADAASKLFMHDPAFPQWMAQVQAMSAEQQVEAVSQKLVELNPGFDGLAGGPDVKKPLKSGNGIENGVIVALRLSTDKVSDLSPVRALSWLREFHCTDGVVFDISPLQGMQLTYVNLGKNRKLSDISPLHGMPLTRLDLYSSRQISDLSPLQGMPLRELTLAGLRVSDLTLLKGMPLSHLYCDRTQVSNLTPLEDCKNLKLLTIHDTKVTAATIAALQKALPSCKIEWDDPAKATTQPAASGTK